MKKIGILGISLISAVVFAGCSTSSSDTETTTQSTESIESTTEASTDETTKTSENSIVDTVTFDGEVKMVIKSVEFTDDRTDNYTLGDPERVLKVTYDVTNLSSQNYTTDNMGLLINGESARSYPLVGVKLVSPGETYEDVIQCFCVDETGEFELVISHPFSVGEDYTIKLDLE